MRCLCQTALRIKHTKAWVVRPCWAAVAGPKKSSTLSCSWTPARGPRFTLQYASMTEGDLGADVCPEAKPPAPSGTTILPSAIQDLDQVLFVEAGWGCDQHGQSVTKAAVRACRNAIEFNSLPAVRKVVPGGYENLRLHVKLGSPRPADVDVEELRKVFPYGVATFEVVEGGLACSSGVAIPELGDTSDEMVIAVAAVTVGYSSTACSPKLETPVKGYGYNSD